jgi:hypothetical protein
MEYEEFVSIFDNGSYDIMLDSSNDDVYEGLNIMAKYVEEVITGAEHDVIYSASISDLLYEGITVEDAKKLSRLDWGINEDFECMYHYV